MMENPPRLMLSQLFSSQQGPMNVGTPSSNKQKKCRSKTDLGALINSYMFNSHVAPSKKKDSDDFSRQQKHGESFNSQTTQAQFHSEPNIQKKKVHNINILVSEKESLSNDKSSQPSLREKRLWDAQVYRTLHSRDSSTSLEKSSVFAKHAARHSMIAKSALSRQISFDGARRKKEINIGTPVHGSSPKHLGRESSIVFSINQSKDQDSTQAPIKSSTSMMASRSCDKVLKMRDNSKEKEKDEWIRFYSRGADPAFASKFELVKRERYDSGSLDTKDKKEENIESIFNKMKTPYGPLPKKHFDESISERLDTFGAFAFTSIEREENREIPAFFSEARQTRDPTGSMGVVDLWSNKLLAELARRAQFSQEKKIIQKFSFYKRKEKSTEEEKKPEFVILSRKNENIYKDLLVRKELIKSQKGKADTALISSMQRHMPLQGRTFYKAREKSNEVKSTRHELKRINGGFARIIKDLNQFAQKNQDDYLKLLEYSASEKNRQNPKMQAKTLKELEKLRKHG